MAVIPNSLVGAPGLIFPLALNSIETGVMKEAKDSEGGFPVFGHVGEELGCYVKQTSASSAVARVVEITPTATTAAGGKVSITIGGTKFEVTSTASTSTVATIIDDLVSAINNSSTGSSLMSATDGTTKITLTAKTAGAAGNSISIVCASTDSGITIASPTTNKTDGADAVLATYYKGFAQRTTRNDKFEIGDVVNVIKKGTFYVKVLGQVQSGEAAYINDTNNGITATSTGATAISGGKFKSNANDGELAVLEIA